MILEMIFIMMDLVLKPKHQYFKKTDICFFYISFFSTITDILEVTSTIFVICTVKNSMFIFFDNFTFLINIQNY